METIFISSAETIFHNPDLLFQILLRLPTLALLKFKFVSKLWLSIISDPHFCLDHTRFHQANGSLSPTAFILKSDAKEPFMFDMLPFKDKSRDPFFDYLDNASDFDVLQSCYGLLLCKSLRSNHMSRHCSNLMSMLLLRNPDNPDNLMPRFYMCKPDNLMSRYFICNPSTKKFKELSFPVRPSQNSFFHVSFAFDPLKSSHYKVICIHKAADRRCYYTLDVYSSKTDSWSVSRISFPINYEIRFAGAIFCNGKIHWRSSGNDSLYFDVENESLEPFPMPISTTEVLIDRTFFGEFRGALTAIVTYFTPMSSEMHVFEMESDYSHWTMKYRLNFEDITNNFPEIRRHSRLCSPIPSFFDVWITQFDKDDEPKVVVWVENKVIFLDSNDKKWKSLHDLTMADSWGEFEEGKFYSYPYIENLSCV